jgi:hypothetical protein
MSIVHQKQKPGHNTCGQTSLAIFLDKPTDEIIRLMGKKGITRSSDLIRVLKMHGYKTDDRLHRVTKNSME